MSRSAHAASLSRQTDDAEGVPLAALAEVLVGLAVLAAAARTARAASISANGAKGTTSIATWRQTGR